MIDLHSHILPEVDDGSSSLEETLQIIDEALSNNVSAIVATPHYLEPSYKEIASSNLELVNKIKRKLNKDIQLYLGNEVYLADNILELIKTNKITTINGSRYLLMELPMYEKPYILDQIIFELSSVSIIPIIAHPERYSYVRKGEEFLRGIIR